MLNRRLNGRGRMAGSVAVTMALLGGAAAVTTPAAHADPVADCAEPAVIDDLVAGQAVNGLTVVSGTTPVSFTGEVLGVYEDGIAPGIPMVMARIDIAALGLPRVDGIWQGMSGSPVYTAGGDLIGAVAYGLAYGTTDVAGITPYADMDDYLDGQGFAGDRVQVTSRVAKTIAKGSEVTAAQASQGFTELQVPLGVSGVRSTRLEKAFTTQKAREAHYLPRDAYQMAAAPAAPSAAVDPDTMMAGGNMAAAMSYGDVTQGGVGTATSVCDGRVVGFGHPASFAGSTSMTLHPADVVYVQEDPLGVPFKLANLGAPAGTVTDDHTTGITGSFGALPHVTDITSTVVYGSRNRTGSSFVSVPDAAASTAFYQQLANHDRVLDGIVRGSELVSWTITGVDNGTPFTLRGADRYASSSDIAFEAPWDIADTVYFLSSFSGVSINDVTIDGTVVNDWSTWRLSQVQQRRAGHWVKITRADAAVARSGKPLALRAVLQNSTGTTTVPLSFAIPKKAKGHSGMLLVTGGASDWSYGGEAESVAQLKRLLASTVRNDALLAQLYIPGRGRGGVDKRVVSEPTDKVVTGERMVNVMVR
ncbi:MAG: hypothetical protein ABWZ91_07865 [Nocardioides sp.]